MKRLFMLLSAVLLLFTTACSNTSPTDPVSEGFPVYFLAPADTVKGSDAMQCSMEPLSFPAGTSLEDQATAITERVLTGSSDGLLHSPFPSDTQLVSITVRDRRVYVDLSGSFARLDGVALTLADYCLTLSLSAIDGIESVTITSSGRMLAQQPRQVFRERDVILSTKDSGLQMVKVLLYFADENGALIAEPRVLEIYEGETQSGNLLAALQEGPISEELFPVIPERFTISSIKVEDGICRINLPAHSLNSLPDDEHSQELILHSLTRSLYSLDSIREIHFSADGVEIQKFGKLSLSDVAKRPRH